MSSVFSRALVQPFVLVGGLSSRFGKPKYFHLIHGTRQIDRLSLALSQEFECEPVMVCRQDNCQEFADYECVVDAYVDCGPMAGIAAALQRLGAGQGGRPWGLIIPCDMYAWHRQLMQIVLTKLELSNIDENVDVIALTDGIAVQPLPSFWHCRTQAMVENAIAHRQLSIKKLISQHAALSLIVDCEASLLQSFNTKEELRKLTDTP